MLQSALRPSLARLSLVGLLLAATGCILSSEAQAQRTIQIAGAKRTAMVTVYIGKSEDVRVDQSFVELTVGDGRVMRLHDLRSGRMIFQSSKPRHVHLGIACDAAVEPPARVATHSKGDL